MSHDSADAHDTAATTSRPIKVGRFLVLLLLVAVGVATSGIASRLHDEDKLTRWTDDQAIPTVALTTLQPELADKEVVLPGDVEAFYSASIHGQASGYVHDWRYDIGANVHRGDILAVIDTPELDERITEAEGELEKAKANQSLAQVTADRWKTLRTTSAVSEQAIDEKVADLRVKDAEVAAATANLDRLRAQKGFAKIAAPFDGVVTSRNIDIGSLVLATGPASQPLFTIADIHKVRVYVRAPESYAASLKDGMRAELYVPEYPDRAFAATIDTTSHAIDAKSRSLLVELIADNSGGSLTPGSFAQVHFQLPPDPNALRLPASALLFRGRSVEVATVNADSRVHLDKVHIARDYGSEVQISGGLPADARIVANPSESIAEGDEVRTAGGAKAEAEAGSQSSGAEPTVAQSGRE